MARSPATRNRPPARNPGPGSAGERSTAPLGPRIGDTELGELLSELSHADGGRANRAALRLGEIGDVRALRSLEIALASPDLRVRVGAASALGSIGRPESREALEATLADPDPRARAQAAYALSRLRDRRSTAALSDRLARDPSAAVRYACALALGRIGDPKSVRSIERALDDESDRVRREAVLALERTGDRNAAKNVRRFLKDPARRVRIAAAVVMGLRRDRAGAPLLIEHLRACEAWERPAVVVALGRIGTAGCGEALARAADDPERWVRVCAIHGLAEMRVPDAAKIARAKTGDRAWAVRGAAALALGRVGDRRDAEALLSLLDDPHPWPRRGAIYALGQLGIRDGLPRIRLALHEPDPEIRLAAIWALGALEDRESLPRLVDQLRSARPHLDSSRPTLAQGDGSVRLVSDADARRFDALVQAVARIAWSSQDSLAIRTLEEVLSSLPPEELGRPARLPTPIGPGDSVLTLRELFAPPRRPRR